MKSRFRRFAGVRHLSPVASNVAISGTLVIGQTLTGTYDYSSPQGTEESGSTYQWYRADDSSGTNSEAIAGATSTTYELVAADEDKYLSFEVTPSDGVVEGSAEQSGWEGIVLLAALIAFANSFVSDTDTHIETYQYPWAKVGNTLVIVNGGGPEISALTTSRIARVAVNSNHVAAYDWSGTNWSLVGNVLLITNIGITAVCALSSSRVALSGSNIDELRTYDFDGTDWSQTGNSFSVADMAIPALTALSSNRVAFIDSANEEMGAFDFDGTDWSLVGNQLSLPGVGFPALAALSATRIAMCDSDIGTLRTFDFDGTDWAQVGNALALPIVNGTDVSLAAIADNKVAFIHRTDGRLRMYIFDGTDWSEIGTAVLIDNDLNIAGITSLEFFIV